MNEASRQTLRVLAANLLAVGELTKREVAMRCGVTDRQLRRWEETPEFQRGIEEYRFHLRSRTQAEGLSKRGNRIAA